MIRNLGKLFMMLCFLAVGGGVVANAQSGPQIEGNVPFAFSVGNTTLPAGKYEIRRLDDSEPSVLELSSSNGRTKVVFETEDTQTREDQIMGNTKLVFNKAGDKYFLSQIWVAGSASVNELPKSKMEKKLEDGGSRSEKQSIVAFLRHLKP